MCKLFVFGNGYIPNALKGFLTCQIDIPQNGRFDIQNKLCIVLFSKYNYLNLISAPLVHHFWTPWSSALFWIM